MSGRRQYHKRAASINDVQEEGPQFKSLSVGFACVLHHLGVDEKKLMECVNLCYDKPIMDFVNPPYRPPCPSPLGLPYHPPQPGTTPYNPPPGPAPFGLQYSPPQSGPSPYNPPPGPTLFGQQYSPPQSGPSPLGPPSHPLPGSGGLDQFGDDDTTQLYPNPSDECGFDIDCFLALENAE